MSKMAKKVTSLRHVTVLVKQLTYTRSVINQGFSVFIRSRSFRCSIAMEPLFHHHGTIVPSPWNNGRIGANGGLEAWA